MDTGGQISLQDSVFIFFRYVTKSGLLDHMVAIFVAFLRRLSFALGSGGGGVFQGQRGWGGQILPNQGFSFCSCCLHAVLFSTVRLFSIKMCAVAWNRLCPSAQRRGSSTTQSAWSLPMAKTGGKGKVPVASLSRAGKRKVRRGQCRDSGGR